MFKCSERNLSLFDADASGLGPPPPLYIYYECATSLNKVGSRYIRGDQVFPGAARCARRGAAALARPRDSRRETWRASRATKMAAAALRKSGRSSRGEAASRRAIVVLVSPRRRTLPQSSHGGGRRHDGIRHQVDHTEITEPVQTVEHREQHNLRRGGHFLQDHHR